MATDSVLQQEKTLKTSNLRGNINIVKAAFIQSFTVWKAYKSALFFFVFLSIILAFIPIFIGRYIAGANFDQNFASNSGGSNPEAFILIGTNGWTFILFALWDYATYLREEQTQGTLESLFLTPASQSWVIIGRGVFSAILALFSFLVGTTIGLLIFDSDLLFSQDFFLVLVAILMLLFSFIPILGLSMMVGALVVRLKEINNIINVLQFVLGSIMGVFFPIILLPIYIQVLGILFPGTWIVQDIRHIIAQSPPMVSLYGLESLLGNFPILFDFLVLILLAIFWALAGWAIFSKTLSRMKRNEGIGMY